MAAIAAKLERYRNPWQELKLQYGANKGKAYTGAVPLSCYMSGVPTFYAAPLLRPSFGLAQPSASPHWIASEQQQHRLLLQPLWGC